MRLLNIRTLRLESFSTVWRAPPYAILSHTWGEDEVLYSDLVGKPNDKEFLELQARFGDLESRFEILERHLQSKLPSTSYEKSTTRKYRKGPNATVDDMLLVRAKQKKSWLKVEGCCNEAARFGLDYVWIDTCCIYKEDSSELSEAINSMFNWYREAAVCFAYLSDASDMDDAFGPPILGISSRGESRWFNRGWTLQELIAPKNLVFYQKDWISLGAREYLVDRIQLITRIPYGVLKNGLDRENNSSLSMATKISWAVGRETTRPEDGIYSLMGLFSVTMPIIYGEGKQSAFFRLQSEIFKTSGDHSIFAWTLEPRSVIRYPIVSSAQFSHSRSNTPKDLIALDPEMFELVTKSRTPFETTSYVVEPSPYDLKNLNISESPVAQSVANYFPLSHGMRVQILLEQTGMITPKGEIFLAHLACKIKDSFDIVGIYLISEQPGKYERMQSDILILIGQERHMKCNLFLADVYITYPDTGVAYQLNTYKYYLIHAGLNIQYVELVDEDLKRSGFMMKECSECDKFVPKVGPYLLVFNSEVTAKSYEIKTHVILFKSFLHAASDVIAVAWKIDTKLHVCNQVQFGPETTVAEIQELSKTLSFNSYSPHTRYLYNGPVQWFDTHWAQRSGDGAGISVAFCLHSGKLMIRIAII